MSLNEFPRKSGHLSFTLGLLLGVVCGAGSATFAQAPSGTDIHLISIVSTPEGPRTGAIKPVTDREGYDNQPHFIQDGSGLIYTSIGADGQADIRHYTLATGDDTALTNTAESEYSPTPTPNGGMSVIRVEPDEKQRLWRFPLAREKTVPVLLLPDVEPVGYHAWIDDRRLILFVLGEPPTLQLATLGGAAPKVIAKDIGRALASIPGRKTMSFVHKISEDSWWVTALDPETGKLELLIETRPHREDYAWAPDGSLWMGDGNKLFRWRPDHDTTWQLIAELPVDELTRLAFHPEGSVLAMVAVRPAEPAPSQASEQR